MIQKDVSLNCVCAWVAWAIAIVVASLNLAYPNNGLDVLAVLFAAAAATLHVREMLHGLEARMARREQQAFQLGRDSVRSMR